VALAAIVLVTGFAHSAFGQASIAIDLSNRATAFRPPSGYLLRGYNNSADGGIYPELVRNRSFEINKPENWTLPILPAAAARQLLTRAVPESFNRRCLHVQVDVPSRSRTKGIGA